MRGVGWVLAAVVVVSCSAERGGTLPAPSGSPSGSVSVSGSPRVLTKAQIEAEAVAAVRAYYAALDRAIRTGDTRQTWTLISSGCACTKLVRFIDEVWRDGMVRGNRFFVVTNAIVREASAKVASISVMLSGDAYEIVDRQNRVKARYPADRDKHVEVTVTRDAESWLIEDVAVR